MSALSHLIYCERRVALIHIEQQWIENRFTAEGRVMHDRVHEQSAESRPGIRIVRGLRLRSLQLGLVGQADVVEFHLKSEISDLKSPQQPFPVEYKRGKPKADHSDEVQLCAQAMCLEEMLDVSIPAGALFYGITRRRQDVDFSDSLRDLTRRMAERLHELVEVGVTPHAVYGPKCDHCSLMQVCLPKEVGREKSVAHYLSQI